MDMNYYLIPHQHDDNYKSSSSNNTSTAYPIALNEPIGRLELITASMKYCKIGPSKKCNVCNAMTSASRYLSKEMMIFSKIETNLEDESSRTLKVTFMKSSKLIQVDGEKVTESKAYNIGEGSTISVLLPNHIEGTKTLSKKLSRLSIHFTLLASGEDPSTDQNNIRKEDPSFMSPPKKAHNNEGGLHCIGSLNSEESPMLTMPQYSNLENNSFESISADCLLTMPSTDIEMQEKEQGADVMEEQKISSLSKETLSRLISECDDSKKGRFRKRVLEIALRNHGGELPMLIRSTRIKLF